MHSIKNREDLEDFNQLISLQSHVKAVRVQEKLGQQNFHEDMIKVFEPVNDTVKNTSEGSTKTMTLTSKENNIALENLNDKLSEILKDRDLLASYLLSPLSKISNLERTS